jgi:two-component system cell cycle response regulator
MLDVALTRPSVYSILTKLKAAPSTWDIPVLIIAPVRGVASVKRCFNLGAYDYIYTPFFREAILARVRNISYVANKLKEFGKLLVRDYLTGLYNRKFFMERMLEEIAWADRYGEPLSFIILDIDHFKKINDTHGHSCGDEVLKELARVLTGMLRAHDVLARYGGEEFVVLLSNTAPDDAFSIGEKLRAGVEESDFYCDEKGTRLPVTISVGVATTEISHDISYAALIKQADEALYKAKAAGRNRVVSARPAGLLMQDEG